MRLRTVLYGTLTALLIGVGVARPGAAQAVIANLSLSSGGSEQAAF
jgi:hypothetical protein